MLCLVHQTLAVLIEQMTDPPSHLTANTPLPSAPQAVATEAVATGAVATPLTPSGNASRAGVAAPKNTTSPWLPYVVTALVVALAFLIRMLLTPLLGTQSPYV